MESPFKVIFKVHSNLKVAMKCTVVFRNVRSFEFSCENSLLTPDRISKPKLKGQSQGDFPIFFVTILINLYQSTLLTHELLLDRQGNNIK